MVASVWPRPSVNPMAQFPPGRKPTRAPSQSHESKSETRVNASNASEALAPTEMEQREIGFREKLRRPSPSGPGPAKNQTQQAAPLHARRDGELQLLPQGGHHVHQRDVLSDHARRRAGNLEVQRHVERRVIDEEAVRFLAVFPQSFAVVACERDY